MAQEETMYNTGAIPTSTPQGQQQQQTAAQGVDILNQLLAQRSQLNEGISQAYKQAVVPVAGVGPGTSPQLAIKPVTPFQQQPLMQQPTVGARATKAKNVGNALIAASNVVGQYAEEHKREQQRVLAVDIERLFQAQDGVREAQQTLQLDPNNAAAKETIQKNNNIIDALLSDPKRRKSIEKAMDISFTDPSKNDQMEHGALQQATNSYSKQLESKIPQQMQPNIVAQQKLQILTGQQQAIDKMIGQIAPALLKEQGAQARAQMSDATRREIAQADIDSRERLGQLNANARYKTAMDSTALRDNAMLRGVAMRNAQSAENLQTRINANLDLLKQRQNDPRAQAKGTLANIQAINGYQKDLTEQNDKLRARLDTMSTLRANKYMTKQDYDTTAAGITEIIKQNDQTLKQLKPLYDQSASYIENLMKGLQSGTGSTTESDGFSSRFEQQLLGPEEDIDNTELDEANNPDNYH